MHSYSMLFWWFDRELTSFGFSKTDGKFDPSEVDPRDIQLDEQNAPPRFTTAYVVSVVDIPPENLRMCTI